LQGRGRGFRLLRHGRARAGRDPVPTPSVTDSRALLIALADAATVAHPSACRLGMELARWAEAPESAALGGTLAAELGVPRDALAAALALRARAPVLARAAERRAAALGVRLVARSEDGYPEAFAALDLPPPAIWIAGALPARPAVAIVGARRASRYGLEIAAWLARGAAEAGALVVSGFAVGVDAAAHRGALETACGRTVAVLGCGLDCDYPRGHRELGERIAAAGARLSEFAPGVAPRPWQFPVRNRLIAALARAVVVVEAAPRSGSLVTARLALDLGRELLAVPGRVTDELALGPNALLADGAAPALTPGDLAAALGLELPEERRPAAPPSAPSGLGDAALALWTAAAAEPASADELAARAGLAVERALVVALELELSGHLRRGADGRYRVP
jgi:DNA processing protein